MLQRQLSPKQVPQLASDWLDSTPGPGKSIWVYVDSRDVGIEIIHRIKRAFSGDFKPYEIPHDSLPGRIVNVKTGNEVYVLSQPDHIQPIMTSMHEWSQGDVERRTGSAQEMRAALGGSPQQWLDETDFQVTGINPETKEAEYIRKPSMIVVDAEEPFWEQLVPMVGQASQVIQTDRVPEANSLEQLMAEKKEQASQLELPS